MTSTNNSKLGKMGWERDLPDFRDYTPEADSVKKVLAKSQALKAAVQVPPKSVDLRKLCWFSLKWREGALR